MLEAVEKFWEETERHDHGLVSGQVVQATFDELHPDESFHVEAKESHQRLFSLPHQSLAQLSDFVVLQQVPEEGVARSTNAF